MHAVKERFVHALAECEDVAVLLRERKLVARGAIMSEAEVARGAERRADGNALSEIVLVEILLVAAGGVEVDPPRQRLRVEEHSQMLEHMAVGGQLLQCHQVLALHASGRSFSTLRRDGPLVPLAAAPPQTRILYLREQLPKQFVVTLLAEYAAEVMGATLQDGVEITGKLRRLQKTSRASQRELGARTEARGQRLSDGVPIVLFLVRGAR